MANILVAVGSNYKDTQIELSGSVYDIRDITNTLQQALGTVILTDANPEISPDLISGLPTKANILSFWQKAITNAKPGDKVILYYTGHATQITDESGSIMDCLVPVDAIANDLNGIGQESLITSYDLYQLLTQAFEEVEVLFVADTYFSKDISQLQTSSENIALTQVEPFKHLTELLNNQDDYSEMLHGRITIITGCKPAQASAGAIGPLTSALIEWIKQNSLEKFLANCWIEERLLELQEAIYVIFEQNGLKKHDLRIFYVDNSTVSTSSSPLTPLSPFDSGQEGAWEKVWALIGPLYHMEHGPEKPTGSKLVSWVLKMYTAYKEKKRKLPFEYPDLIELPPDPLKPNDTTEASQEADSEEAPQEKLAENTSEMSNALSCIDSALTAEVFDVNKFLDLEPPKTLTPTFDSAQNAPSSDKKTKHVDKEDKRQKKRFKPNFVPR